MNKKLTAFLTALAIISFPVFSFANVEALKIYREGNPDLKPDCMYCHIDKLPKKDDGKHELNAYGLAVEKAFEAEKTAELTKDQIKEIYTKIFTKLGRHDQFKAVEETTTGAENAEPSEKKE